MTDTAKVEHKVMGLNDKKTGEQSNGLKVEVSIFILLIIGAIVIIGFWLGVGWPDELPDNFSNLLTVEAVKEYLDYRERIRAARLQFLTTIAASLGAIGVVFNLYYTGKREEAFNKSAIAANKSAKAALENAKAALKNAEAAQDKQITERFTKAIELISSKEITTRIGGIYALERIANNSKDDHWAIMEVLTAFVREQTSLKAPLEEKKPEGKEPPLKLRVDIQAALTVIGRRDLKKDPDGQRLDLRNSNIRGANLIAFKLQRALLDGANLQEANLTDAHLEEAKLRKANLQKAELFKAKMHRANLIDAHLEEATLDLADLQEADLWNAQLQGTLFRSANLARAKLPGANLQGARLKEANLQEASFCDANLQRSNLTGADLRRARLDRANLQGADLSEANMEETTDFIGVNLEGANLYNAKLQGADLNGAKNLKQEQIEKAFGNKNTTRLPENLKVPEHWTESE
ncbi:MULTISPECIES: pentapeptide repeat-containing protein [unclassified Coleofasciculus]|uniref:pentapeptide repeat-containing protein n=1 Tax=unclassified Coleofasciculus TaxID=2692782 RepID=UPI00187F5311|nr:MULTISPECIES: pentapeptide repeat-containing protein [unclassified Coleofasciculus]MBE9126859.1 pentapeptide repeat-containing protein [Coleofasciculus sp. LEGE 07081]MBE9150224.1 pentapeptide repeat-containing protein [Coleofasciculus sp. LEGE 07092]